MSARRAALLALLVGFLLAFALLVVVGGRVNPGYLQSRDYVSYLASRGASQAWIGMLAIASFAAAHAVGALTWRGVAPTVWAALLTCSALGLVTALSRLSCPGGAARCSTSSEEPAADLWDLVHGLSVGGYEVSFVLAAICAAAALLRRRRLWSGALVLVLALLSVRTVSSSDLTPGGEQRVWLAVNALGLLAMAAAARSARPARARAEAAATSREQPG